LVIKLAVIGSGVTLLLAPLGWTNCTGVFKYSITLPVEPGGLVVLIWAVPAQINSAYSTVALVGI